jgi:hypothetical protein
LAARSSSASCSASTRNFASLARCTTISYKGTLQESTIQIRCTTIKIQVNIQIWLVINISRSNDLEHFARCRFSSGFIIELLCCNFG